jgi:hypothetical protein
MAAQQVDTLEPYRMKVVHELPTGKQSAEESRASLKHSFKISYKLTTVQPSAKPSQSAKHYQMVTPDYMRSTGTCGVFHVIPTGSGWFHELGSVYQYEYHFDMTFDAIGSKTDPSSDHCKLSLADV